MIAEPASGGLSDPMARNDDGEFELVLGNRQLLSVFFIVVVLLGVFFTMGYIVGRNSAPVAAEIQKRSEPLTVDAAAPPAPVAAPAKEESAPTHTAPQLPTDSSAPIETPKDEVKSAPVTAKAAKADPEAARIKAAEAKRSRNDQPASGQAYLQLAATSRREADVMVDVLREKGFKALAAEIDEKPGTFRVLVGPVADGTTNGIRADLQKSGFPGNAAIRRTF
jgi:hypothetical protein